MLIDSHLHTIFSGDSETPPDEQIAKALEIGLSGLCFTDHDDHDVVSDVDFNLDIPAYMKKMQELKSRYSDRLDIRIGIESGLQTHIVDYQDNIAKEYDFDFIIGSIHFIDGLDPYFPEYFHKFGKDAYNVFFECTLENIKCHNAFDSLGHLDYIVRYGREHGLQYSYKEYSDIIDTILQVLISKGKALECNTGALCRGLDEPNPCFDAIRRYRELRGELITLGSDAHSPETLGYRFAETCERLKAIGFGYYTIYRDRKPEMIRL